MIWKEIQYLDENSKDKDSNVRQKTKAVTNLLQNESRPSLRVECRWRGGCNSHRNVATCSSTISPQESEERDTDDVLEASEEFKGDLEEILVETEWHLRDEILVRKRSPLVSGCVG